MSRKKPDRAASGKTNPGKRGSRSRHLLATARERLPLTENDRKVVERLCGAFHHVVNIRSVLHQRADARRVFALLRGGFYSFGEVLPEWNNPAAIRYGTSLANADAELDQFDAALAVIADRMKGDGFLSALVEPHREALIGIHLDVVEDFLKQWKRSPTDFESRFKQIVGPQLSLLNTDIETLRAAILSSEEVRGTVFGKGGTRLAAVRVVEGLIRGTGLERKDRKIWDASSAAGATDFDEQMRLIDDELRASKEGTPAKR